MNYKIKVTAENREAIKEIADRNGMNEIGFNFEGPNPIYHIEKGCFTTFPIPPKDPRNYQELTFEQFKAMFDKQEPDLEKWLMETKAKSLSLEELKNYIFYDMSNIDFNELRKKLGLKQGESLAQALLKQWNEPKPHGFCEEKNSKCTDNYCDENGCVARKRILTEPKAEWHPKRGDRVLVFDEHDCAVEAIFLTKIEGAVNSICTVNVLSENEFLNNKPFYLSCYKHMKPLPPTEPEKTFKDKVIELIEDRMEDLYEKTLKSKEANDFTMASLYCAYRSEASELLEQIKETE